MSITKVIKKLIKDVSKTEPKHKLNKMKDFIELYMSLTSKQLEGIEPYIITRTFSVLVNYIKSNPSHDDNIHIRAVAYNKALTSLLNNNNEYDALNNIINDLEVKEDIGGNLHFWNNKDLYGSFLEKISTSSTAYINSSFTKGEHFAWKYMNGKPHIILSANQTCRQSLNDFSFQNPLGYESIMLNISPTDIEKNITSKGCDWIKHYVFKPTKTGNLYFLTLTHNEVVTYKVGITKHSVEKRFKALPKDIAINNEIVYNRPMLECAIIEKYLLETNRITSDMLPDSMAFEGSSECFATDLHPQYDDTVLDRAIEYLGTISYPLSKDMLNLAIKEINE